MKQEYTTNWTAINASAGLRCDRCHNLLRARVYFIDIDEACLHATLCYLCATTVEAILIMEEFNPPESSGRGGTR